MKRSRTTLLLLLSAVLPLLAIAAEVNPPTSTTIYQTLEQLWSNRQYDELKTYIETLDRSWGDYVPVQIASAIYSYKYGAQVEDAIDRLNTLRARLQPNIAASSPVFMELLDSRILRYEKTKKFYLQQSISRANRLTERNPLKKTEFKPSKHWGEEMLFFNAPEAFLTESGVRSAAIKDRVATAVPSLDQALVKTLQRDVGDEKKPMAERKAFAQELVRRRVAEGGISNLVQSIRAGDSSYTYQDTVEELAKAGPSAIPALIEFINDPAHFPRDQKMAIWALVRIGVADAEVIRALQAVSAITDRADLVKYAQDALHYLQSKKQ